MYKSTGLIFGEKPSIGVEPTRLYDRSRFGNHGTHTDITMVQLPNGLWVRRSNGTTSLINCGSAVSLANIFDGGGTGIAWIKASNGGEVGEGRIWDKSRQLLNVQNEASGKLKLRFYQNFATNGMNEATDSTEITLDVWTQVAVTYNNDSNSNRATLYVNGAVKNSSLITTAPSGARTSDIGNTLVVGNDLAANITFDGDMALFRLHNYAFSAGQIKNIYEKERKDWFNV